MADVEKLNGYFISDATARASITSQSTQIANNIGRSGWNQLVHGNFADSNMWVVYSGATYSVANNEATVTPSGGSSGIRTNTSDNKIKPMRNATKFFISAEVYCETANDNLQMGLGGFGAYQIGTNISVPAGVWTRVTGINNFWNGDIAAPFAFIWTRTNSNLATFKVRNFFAVDISELYGFRLEPTTTAQFIADYPQIYYPKCNSANDMVGDSWISNITYAVGSFCIYDNKLYKCLVQHSNKTPTDTTYWTQTSVGAELTVSGGANSSGIYLYRVGKLRVISIQGGSLGSDGKTLTYTIPEADRPIVMFQAVGKAYNGTAYVDCLVRVNTDGTITETSLGTSVISGIQPIYTKVAPIAYFTA